MLLLVTLSDRLGASDCEAISSGFLAQPVNAWSSLAFSVVGVLIAVSATQVEGRERVLRTVFGLLLIATGIGSFLFHGPQPPAAHFVHDITFLAALWLLAVANLNAALGKQPATGWIAFAAGVGVIAALLIAFPAITNILTGITLGALVVSDLALRRRAGIGGWWYTGAVVVAAAAVVLLIGGRSGSAWCDPVSAYQAHGGWHVFAAAALGIYFVATSNARLTGRRLAAAS